MLFLLNNISSRSHKKIMMLDDAQRNETKKNKKRIKWIHRNRLSVGIFPKLESPTYSYKKPYFFLISDSP